MRKNVIYLGLLFLIGVMTACSNHENLNPEHNKQVCLGIDIDRGVRSRAETPIPPENYALRCIIEIWNSEGTTVIYREEKLITDGSTLDFNFELQNMGSYPAFAWADYVKADAEKISNSSPITYEHYEDLYYKTDSEKGLKEISIIPENYVVNEVNRDGFYTHWIIYKQDVAYTEEITLKRPFAQINIIEEETELLQNVAEATFIYNVPKSFDTEKGIPSTTYLNVNKGISTLPEASSEYNANLLYDYIFASTSTGILESDIQIHFSSTDSEKKLRNLTIPGNNIPLVSNRRTNARGAMLHFTTEPDITSHILITIETEWGEDNDYGLPNLNSFEIPIFINQGNPFINTQEL